jgi:S-adenosylmethionine:tRNA ribosyltransferase-isomerase
MKEPGISHENLPVSQWEPYEQPDPSLTRAESLEHLLKWLDERKMNRLITRTRILIAPGYKLRMVRGLITNFHQPRSTLLLLVAAIVGDAWKKIYHYALENGFRFLSYGDGSLLEVNERPAETGG